MARASLFAAATLLALADVHPDLQVNGRVYHRLGILGRGGSSKVYRVTTERNDLLALKRVDTRNDSESRASFINEITLLRKLAGKPEIIQLVDSEIQGKYVVMVRRVVGVPCARKLELISDPRGAGHGGR